jgi:Ser/Thr protein kinase RdoA (MazF antagonist)
MPLSEIAGLAATVGADGRSEVADAVAARWGLPAGAARFWRSSACHVFAVRDPAAAYLRFVPAHWRARVRVEAVATVMERLGTGVAAPLQSVAGRLVETVATPAGTVHATLVAAAPGRPIDVADLTAAQALAWGAALARLHRDAHADGLPETFGGDPVDGDPALAEAVARLRTALAGLPRDADCFGAVHGDFELDNLAWVADTPTAYDFDDAGRSWFVADIGHALRDVLAPGADPAGVATAERFLAGYRTVRRLSDVELGWLPLFAAAYAAAWLRRLPAVLDVEPSPAGPSWLGPLRERLTGHARRQRDLVLAWRP